MHMHIRTSAPSYHIVAHMGHRPKISILSHLSEDGDEDPLPLLYPHRPSNAPPLALPAAPDEADAGALFASAGAATFALSKAAGAGAVGLEALAFDWTIRTGGSRGFLEVLAEGARCACGSFWASEAAAAG
mmetsp:Transcript_27700/g.84549  ORF Transcript_27700/g.84549 Transcript_27700/m.84549 type:complete len:131 (-) Transcript_27700:671-1063(-)